MNRQQRRARARADQGHRAEAALQCPKHGAQPWHGDVKCKHCERLYHVHDLPAPELLEREPKRCACGLDLRPLDLLPVCAACARDAGHPARPEC